jgi:hypothetical protein
MVSGGTIVRDASYPTSSQTYVMIFLVVEGFNYYNATA